MDVSFNSVSVNAYIIKSQKTVRMSILFLKISNKEKQTKIKTRIFTQNQLSMKKKLSFFFFVYQFKNK